jgi:hypothetical protein
MKLAIHPSSAVLGAALATVCAALLGMQGPAQIQAQALPVLTPEQAAILSCFSLVDLDDGFGNKCRTLRVSRANFQVVNGLGAT